MPPPAAARDPWMKNTTRNTSCTSLVMPTIARIRLSRATLASARGSSRLRKTTKRTSELGRTRKRLRSTFDRFMGGRVVERSGTPACATCCAVPRCCGVTG